MKVPDWKAPAEQVPWLRWAQGEIETLTRDSSRKSTLDVNANKGQSATLEAIVKQIDDLRATQAELAAQQVTLARQIEVQGSPKTGHSTAGGYALTTSPLELTRVTFDVPANVTRALILATSNTSVVNQDNTLLDILRGYIDINGIGIGTPGPTMIDPLHWANINSSGSQVLGGLEEGDTFYVASVAYNDFGLTGASSANNICNLDVAVVFLP